MENNVINAVDNDNNHQGNSNIYTDIGIPGVAIVAQLHYLHNIHSKFQQWDQFSHEVPQNLSNVSYLKDRWNDIVGKGKDISPKVTKMLSSAECLSSEDSKSILDEIKKAKVDMASATVILGALASAAIILAQIWRLREVWLAIKDAQNVVDQSGSKINEINAQINQLNTWATELRGLMEKYENGTQSEPAKQKLVKSINHKISRMSTTYLDTRNMILELKVDVDGKRQVLAVYKREQISNGIINSVHCVTNLIQYFQLSGLLSTGLVALQVGITSTFLTLSVANGCMYKITGKELDKLREKLRQILELDAQLRGILHIIQEAQDWVAVNDE